jgi:hypothetical protein
VVCIKKIKRKKDTAPDVAENQIALVGFIKKRQMAQRLAIITGQGETYDNS